MSSRDFSYHKLQNELFIIGMDVHHASHGRDDSANENEAAPRGGLALVRTASAARLDGLGRRGSGTTKQVDRPRSNSPRLTVSTMSLTEVDLGRAPGSTSLLVAFLTSTTINHNTSQRRYGHSPKAPEAPYVGFYVFWYKIRSEFSMGNLHQE